MTPMLDRYRGCLLGLACGDAVGTTVEFSPRGSFQPLTDMVGGGPFALAPGQWTDDTSMALCLAASLLHCGSLMRLAPAVLYGHPDLQRVLALARASSATTHAAPEALECCELLAGCLHRALSGASKDEVLEADAAGWHCARVAALAEGGWRRKSECQLRGSGYCVESLEAALWCFASTSSFEAVVLHAANLGDDADTTAAIAGQLAGAFYGVGGIPGHWLARLHLREEIDALACTLFGAGAAA